ncbi:NifU family protein [Candidatus Bandiella euplotis]|uniref:Fe/S biogenesis protein NifU-like protein n=1 Tax=Candidatus Bandiella euplotis TaxID=1664265 RepID=A0ABZ0UIS9_9RICK|nr:NifU family protein [Candidatus Bandiella woodruffii]WPX95991.1 Fe/S biogenesis protein NifU-like protein [Candidatus Bandiella woodruffii]
MYIQTQDTPNPNTIKFIPGVEVLKKGTYHFNNDDDYSNSPLAKRLFEIDGVKSVFLGKDFVSVTKEEDIAWDRLKTYVLAGMVDHFIAGIPVIEKKKEAGTKKLGIEKINSEIERQIIELIETKIRPAVAQDGGDITYKNFENGVVYLELHGACQGCPSSTITLKQGIESMLKYYVPEVQSVESI